MEPKHVLRNFTVHKQVQWIHVPIGITDRPLLAIEAGVVVPEQRPIEFLFLSKYVSQYIIGTPTFTAHCNM
jgi:hypothetical protein